MPLDLLAATKLTDAQLRRLSKVKRRQLLAEVIDVFREDRRHNQLRYYEPANPDALAVHYSTARVIGVVGGKRSTKTDTMLAEASIQMTGVIPHGLEGRYPTQKLRPPPIRVRLVVTSLTNAWDVNLKQKLQWFEWNGKLNEDGLIGDPRKGHWGWMPRRFLKDGDWAKAWSEKHRQLTLTNGSTLTVMCLRGDQRVLMASGAWRAIEQLSVGDQLCHPRGIAPIKALHRFPAAPLWKIRTTGGHELVATAEHRHMQEDGTFRRTDELSIGDTLAVWSGSTRILSEPPVSRWKLGWLALMLGDGCMRGRSPRLTAMPGNRVLRHLPPLPKDLRLCPVRLGEYEIRREHYGGPHRRNSLKAWLQQCGVWGLKSSEKFVPDCVFRQSLTAIAYFLRHLWNCDGTVSRTRKSATYYTISHRLAFDVKYLLWTLGISCSIGEADMTGGFCGDRTIRAYRVLVSGGSWNRFRAALAGRRDFQSIPTSPRGILGKIVSMVPVEPAPVFCLEIDHPDHVYIVDGLVTHNSWEQELQEFEQGAFHLILEDELGPEDRHRANLTRVLDYGGQVLIGGTPSDDYAAAVNEAWFNDQVYAPGLSGSNPRDVFAVTLWTERNRTLDPEDVAWLEKGLTLDQREARLHGKFLHLAGLILPGVTEHPRTWCFGCRAPVLLLDGVCPTCGRRDAVEYCHVWGDEEMVWPGPSDWSVLFYMDPHQSRPTACAWFKVDRNDAVWQVAELEVQGDAFTVKTAVEAFERAHALHPLWRKGDPKIGVQPNQFAEEVGGETFTIKRAFADVGFFYEDANTNFTVARERLLQWFQPDPYTRQPKLRIHRSCTRTIYQVTHFVWQQSRHFGTTAEKPGKKDSDFPALLRYCANDDPDWRGLERVRRPEAVVIGAGGTGRNPRVGW